MIFDENRDHASVRQNKIIVSVNALIFIFKNTNKKTTTKNPDALINLNNSRILLSTFNLDGHIIGLFSCEKIINGYSD